MGPAGELLSLLLNPLTCMLSRNLSLFVARSRVTHCLYADYVTDFVDAAVEVVAEADSSSDRLTPREMPLLGREGEEAACSGNLPLEQGK